MNLKTIQGMARPPKLYDLQLHPGQLKAKPRSPQLSMGQGGALPGPSTCFRGRRGCQLRWDSPFPGYCAK